jgi:hypothetical protein
VVVLIMITTTFSGYYPDRTYRPATHPIHFAADSPDKIIAALHGRYFSFSQIKSYVVVQSSKIRFWLLTAQLQSVILAFERSRT